MPTLLVSLTLDVNRYVTSLIVGPVIADCLATRAKSRDRRLDSQYEVVPTGVPLSDERAIVVHKSPGSGHRCFPLEKVRECDFDSGALSLEPILYTLENC